MNRAERFQSLKNHPMLKNDFKKLKSDEIAFCLNFLTANQSMTDDQFSEKANRLGLHGELARFKNKTIIWGLLIQSVEPKVRKK